MKSLVAYYSRTGNTKAVAEQLAKLLAADIEEIVDLKRRGGIFGWLSAGSSAFREKPASIKPPAVDPSQYGLVVVGTPVWAGKMSCAARTYLTLMAQPGRAPKAVAFFTTSGGVDAGTTLPSMEALLGKAPVATASFVQKDISGGKHAAQLESFAARLAQPK